MGGEVSKIVFSLMLRGDDRKWEVVKADITMNLSEKSKVELNWPLR